MTSLDYTTEDLAKRNGAGLLAMQLQMLQRDYNDATRRHDERIRNIRAELTKAERIGLAVLSAEAAGRKTIRIEKLMEES